jgi:hypothetical protein
MRLYQHKHEAGTLRSRKQTFCGPGALSVILGITAERRASSGTRRSTGPRSGR